MPVIDVQVHAYDHNQSRTAMGGPVAWSRLSPQVTKWSPRWTVLASTRLFSCHRSAPIASTQATPCRFTTLILNDFVS